MGSQSNHSRPGDEQAPRQAPECRPRWYRQVHCRRRVARDARIYTNDWTGYRELHMLEKMRRAFRGMEGRQLRYRDLVG